MPTNRKRITVNIPPELTHSVEARAKELGRSQANYLEWLVRKDIRESGEIKLPKESAHQTPQHMHGKAEDKNRRAG